MANIVRRGEPEGGVVRRDPYQFLPRDPFRSIADVMRFPFDELERTIGVRPVVVPDVDLRETQDAYILEVDLPGFKQDDIEITITGDRLTISGRRELWVGHVQGITFKRSPYRRLTSSRSDGFRAVASTRWPASSAARAVARPSPRELPVMNQTCKRPSIARAA